MGIDTDTWGAALIAALRLEGLRTDLPGHILMRKSSSGRGWHFRLILDGPITDEAAMRLRACLGDCKGRFQADLARMDRYGHPEDVLFDHKCGKDAEPWRPLDLGELNRPAFWSAKFIMRR